MSFLIALVFAELGALVSSSGALAQIPLLTHGRAAGFLGGWASWLGYVAIPAIEVLATVQYLGSSLPWLTRDGGAGQVLSGWGLLVASLLLVLFAWINLAGVGVLARWIEGLTVWKLVVPLTVSLALISRAAHWNNLSIAGGQSGGVLAALGTGGILFSLLGFRTAMDLAGEAPPSPAGRAPCLPQLDRPFRLPWAPLLCPLTFVLASWAIVWCGWTSLRLAVPLVLLPALLFVILRRGRNVELGGSLWWLSIWPASA
jgi:amino acid transporter